MSRSRIRFRRPDLWKPVSGAMQAVPPADCPGWGYVRREDYAALEFEYRLALTKLASAGRIVAELKRQAAKKEPNEWQKRLQVRAEIEGYNHDD